VSYELPSVVKKASPLTGAVQRYQIECSFSFKQHERPEWIGSPGSAVAFTVEPVTLPLAPSIVSASAK
jgi:hypothetical protein